MNGICTMVTVAGQPEEPQPDWLQMVLMTMLMLVLMTTLDEGVQLW